MFSTAVPYFAAILSIIACFASYSAVHLALRMRKFSATPSRLAQIDAELAELTDSVTSLSTTMKKLAGRQAMRDHRARQKSNGGDVPDWRDDPAAYKRAMRLKYGLQSGVKEG